MEYTFYVESKFRTWYGCVNYLKFRITDGTEFILSDEWVLAKRKNRRTPLQRLIFLKRNNYANVYNVTVEVSSTSNQTSGKIVSSRKTKPLRTSIIILLSDFQKLRYPVQEKVILEEVEICKRIMTDTFKYKITLNRLDESENEAEVIPEREKILTLSDQLHSLLETGDFADIVIANQGGSYEIRAHRNILAARTDYFRGTFESNLKESRENQVTISGISMTVIKEILDYIYSGVIRPMKLSDRLDLYTASNYLSLDDLEELLRNELIKYLNAENALDIYMKAYYASDNDLKLRCLEVILGNFETVQTTHLWRRLQNEEERRNILHSSEILQGILQFIN